MKRNNYHFVYNKALRNQLMDANEEYICVAHALTSFDRFWLFEKNEVADKIVRDFVDGWKDEVA